MHALTRYPPNRTAALERLSAFLPRAGRDYAAQRNYDLGEGDHRHVSNLSPYIRHRTLTEEDVLKAVLARHSASAAQKFVQEVYWRSYWKGWLEMRPAVWGGYFAGLAQRWDEVQTQSGLRRAWEDACRGDTGIDCFDHWAQELVTTGYLHNHARMWFASIWIFTLRLPWELGADFFLRHLLDGDPASNTLGWRWVGGLQTIGKTYLAKADNIARFTEGRFHPSGLSATADPLSGPPHPPRMAAPVSDTMDASAPSVLVLHEDDLSPGWLLDSGVTPLGTAFIDATDGLSVLEPAPHVRAFKSALMAEAATRYAARLGPVTTGLTKGADVADWARNMGASQIITPYAPVGPSASLLHDVRDLPVRRVLRAYDSAAWPYATAGFFKFKEKIPRLVGTLKGLQAV